MILSCAFATAPQTPEHARVAEELGYTRAYFYDSPALYPDVWMQLSQAASRTERIGLGTGVLIPSLRHPLTTASAISTLAGQIGPERVNIGVGSGFTGRVAMGQRPNKWRYVHAWVAAVQGLLRGEIVEWDGGRMQMLHTPGFAPPRPIEVTFLLGVGGPKGLAAARELGTSIFIGDGGQPPPEAQDFNRVVKLTMGTVLEDGESVDSQRVREAAGHAAAVTIHHAYEFGGLDDSEWSRRYRARYETIPAQDRHLTMHGGHLVTINDTDGDLVGGEQIAQLGYAKSAAQLRERLVRWSDTGVTEVAYQPAGPDIARELEAFAAVFASV
jgi:5,10-methylenetetrahydromethanopterin reductase